MVTGPRIVPDVVRIVEICRVRMEELLDLRRVPLHHPADGPPPLEGEE